MDNRQFVGEYQSPEDHFRFTNTSPEVNELLEGPRMWASFFDRQLSLYLSGAPGEDPAKIYKQIDSYKYEWVEPHLDASIDQTQKLMFHDLNAEHGTSELTFHVLNSEFIPLWRRVLLPETQNALGADQLQNMQIRLAIRAATLARTRARTLEKEATNGLHTNIVDRINDQLSRIDTGITLLEVLKDDSFEDAPQLAALPAPPRFESTANPAQSADFIVLDMKNNLSQGIKTGHSYNDADSTDSNYITRIDGVLDLNNLSVQFDSNGEVVTAPNPGLLALNFLKFDISINKLSRNPAFNKRISEVMRAKEEAKRLSISDSSYLFKAAKNIQSKIMTDLYT